MVTPTQRHPPLADTDRVLTWPHYTPIQANIIPTTQLVVMWPDRRPMAVSQLTASDTVYAAGWVPRFAGSYAWPAVPPGTKPPTP